MIDPRDRGFTLGDGAFETMRSQDGSIHCLDAHLGRLHAALAKLRIPAPPDLEARLLDAAAGPGERALRLTVTRGPAAHGLLPRGDAEPTVVITTGPIPPPPPSLSAIIASGRKNERAAGAGLKLLGYTEAVLALLEARDAGADEALFLDTEGHLSEATASNLFLVRGGRVVTPPAGCGVLPGVTRAAVIELGDAQEEVLVPEDLATADEAFLTSTLRGVVPLLSVDGAAVGDGTPGPVTSRLQRQLEVWRA
jgi:branched-chain amino acid aminotransferase